MTPITRTRSGRDIQTIQAEAMSFNSQSVKLTCDTYKGDEEIPLKISNIDYVAKHCYKLYPLIKPCMISSNIIRVAT